MPTNMKITVFVFDTKHKVKVTPKVAAKRQKGYEYDVHKYRWVRKKGKKVHPVEFNPRVTFFYPHKDGQMQMTQRDVRVIGANEKYLVGLQINDKNKFKKFLKHKMSNTQLVEFSPESVS